MAIAQMGQFFVCKNFRHKRTRCGLLHMAVLLRQHLAELGFVVDSDVTVVSEIAGNLILQVKDSRIALDKTMANRIMI